MRKLYDILLVARPDHSLQIYNELRRSNFSFLFCCFKVVPLWLKRIIPYKKLTVVGKNSLISWRLSFINVCRYRFRFSFAQTWNEMGGFDGKLRRVFKKKDFSIIHYWPEYGDNEIRRYCSEHPQCHPFADIHMPNPRTVLELMTPVYEKFGINPQTTQLWGMASSKRFKLHGDEHILVPSTYVAETYKNEYPSIHYDVVSYGITVNPDYKLTQKEKIAKFVYAGRISLEKGADLLFEFFSSHPELSLYVYGTILPGQEFVFGKYKNTENIHFMGVVPKSDLSRCFLKYDVGIHLSRFDAYSLAVGEMIGSGLPVIISKNTGNADDVLQYGVGEVVELSLKSVENAVNKMTDPQVYKEKVNNINEWLNNSQTYGERMIKFYKLVLAGRS